MNRFPWMIFAFVAPLITLSCSSGQSKPSSPTRDPTSWAGTWLKLDGLAIPAVKQVRIGRGCNGTNEYWTIEQHNDTVTLEFHDAVRATGIQMAFIRKNFEKASGERRKSFARLEGEFGSVDYGENIPENNHTRTSKFPVTYELDYDPKTEQLGGTRNGSPVRFVRAEFQEVDRSKCQPVP